MLQLAIRRHLMPALSLVTWLGAALGAHAAPAVLALGLGLFALFWIVEGTGIEGCFAGEVPRHPVVTASRVLWLGALAFAVFDAERLHLSSGGGWPLRLAGAALFLGGVALRLASMRTLRRAFSYDVKVTAGQELVTHGPYAAVRHPAYTGLVVLSLSCGIWNPSAIGLVALAVTTLPQVLIRVAHEERVLAAHFGARWSAYTARTRRLVPGIW